MSYVRLEKRRAPAELTLAGGSSVEGAFFLASSTASHSGPERVSDLLNGSDGFFPFELTGDGNPRTVLYNRTQIVTVALPPTVVEAQLDPGYALAPRYRVSMLLSGGTRVTGTVSVYRPSGQDRLSDYAQAGEPFRYLEVPDRTLIINFAHIVELAEVPE